MTLLAKSDGTAYFEQHLAAALNMGHGVTEGRDRIGCRDGSVDRAGCNERHALTHRRGDLWLELRIALKKTLRNYSLCDQIHWVDRRRLSAHQRVGDDSAALGERACNGGCRRSGDAIDTERYPPVTNRLTHLVQNASLVDEHDVAARSLELRDKLCASNKIDRPQPPRFGDCNDRAADTRIGCVLGHPIAGLEIDIFAQQQRCRGRIDAQHGKLARIRVRRQGEQSLGGQNHPLAPTESVQGNQNAVADLQVPDVPAYGQNASDSLIPNHARHGGPYRKHAFDQVEIIHVDRGEFHAHQNFVRGRDGRLWKLDKLEDFEWWAEIPHLDRMHGRSPFTTYFGDLSALDE